MGDNNNNDLFGTTDAQVWAQRFVEMVKKNPAIATDEGTMLAWFAGSIQTGVDHTKAEQRANEPEFITLPREALIQFFGEMALPPWRDEHGDLIGSNIDCAPIAQKIANWLKMHDLTGVVSAG